MVKLNIDNNQSVYQVYHPKKLVLPSKYHSKKLWKDLEILALILLKWTARDQNGKF